LEFNVCRLLRCGSNNRFVGSVHEYVAPRSVGQVPSDIVIACNNSRYGIEKTQKRFQRDRGLLLKDFAANPKDPRSAFYLAQTYECLGELENAYRFYDLHLHLDGWDEERYESCYRLGYIVETLAQRDTKKETIYDWSLALWYYLKAFSMRNHRIEPLIRIARHYIAVDDHVLAYIFARRALNMPFPKNEILFVEKSWYDYERYEIVGRCAWYVGDYEVGEQALRKGLEKYPDDKLLLQHLEHYTNRKTVENKK
jgi:hypothetical protein